MLRAERRASIECIWLERPAQHNALVPELLEALREHLASLQSSPPAAVVLTGAGSDFCVGADVRWMDTWRQPAEGVALLVAAHHAAVAAMRATPAPIVAAVNGAAAGGGLSLALAADVRVAGRGATFTAAWTRLGLPPDGGASAFLVRGIGANRALELLLGNRSLSAEQALDWGLVNRLAPDAELIDDACTFAASLAGVPSDTLLTTRRLLDAAGALPLETVLQREALAMRSAARRPAFRARLRALLDRL
jgi:2-(1,2-epoxy-1,2-dihydrophenyl)acetyl-CoA isomerase